MGLTFSVQRAHISEGQFVCVGQKSQIISNADRIEQRGSKGDKSLRSELTAGVADEVVGHAYALVHASE